MILQVYNGVGGGGGAVHFFSRLRLCLTRKLGGKKARIILTITIWSI